MLYTAWQRRQVAVASQEPVLFRTSTGKEIRYCDVTSVDITRKIRAAESHDMIILLEGQYNMAYEGGTSRFPVGKRRRAALFPCVSQTTTLPSVIRTRHSIGHRLGEFCRTSFSLISLQAQLYFNYYCTSGGIATAGWSGYRTYYFPGFWNGLF